MTKSIKEVMNGEPIFPQWLQLFIADKLAEAHDLIWLLEEIENA